MWSKAGALLQCLVAIRGAFDDKATPLKVPPQCVGTGGSSFDQQGPGAEIWFSDIRYSSGPLTSNDLLDHAGLDRAYLKDTRLIGGVKTLQEGPIPYAQSLRGRVGFAE